MRKKISGHELDGPERYWRPVGHMFVFDILDSLSPVGAKGDRVRLFLADAGLAKAMQAEKDGHIRILAYARVVKGQVREHKRFGLKEESAWLYLGSRKMRTTR